MADLSVFAETYADARANFLDAVRAAGARHVGYEHASAKGPAGERLFLDAAMLGPADAARVFVVASGTHGIEGFPGSAAQSAWLLGRPKRERQAGRWKESRSQASLLPPVRT